MFIQFIFFHEKRNLGLGGPENNELADGHVLPLAEYHFVGEEAEIGLVDFKHGLYGVRGEADFFADDFFSSIQAVLQKGLGDVVSVFNGDVGCLFGEWTDSLAAAHGLVEHGTEAFDIVLGHSMYP